MKRGRGTRRVAIVTGTRAEYGLLRSTIEAVDAHTSLKLQIVVCGMHLLRKFGYTVRAIHDDNWPVDIKVRMQRGDDSPLDQAEGLARGIRGMGRFFESAQTDIVVVLGDRVEAMAGALGAITTGRLLAHIHGGDLAPGDLDESFRHAITKLAHVHLAATKGACERIARMGEDRSRIHWVGAPGLDRIRTILGRSRRRPSKSGCALVVQHPCGRSAMHERRVMSSVLRAVYASNLSPTILYPNSDRGHTGIVEAIDAYRAKSRNGCVKVFRSLGHDDYLRLLARCDLLVGNSSSGMIEAAAAGTPSVNVGKRQEGRERGGPSVIDCAEQTASIRDAISRALRTRPITNTSGPYGRGDSGHRMADILAKVSLDPSFLRKLSVF